MSDLSYDFFRKSPSVNPVDKIGFITVTKWVSIFLDSQTKIQEPLDDLRKDETSNSFQRFSNRSLKKIFDKEPKDYWVNED